MKIKSSKNLDTMVLPTNMMRQIYSFIEQFVEQFEPQDEICLNKLHNGSYTKKIEVNLSNWSGLNQWYKNLQKIKQFSKHRDNYIINNIVLDPTLCIKILNDQTADQYYYSDFENRKKTGFKMYLYVTISQLQNGVVGVQNRGINQIQILNLFNSKKEKENLHVKKIKIQKMKEASDHQVRHFLDTLTALTFKENLQILRRRLILKQKEKQNSQFVDDEHSDKKYINNNPNIQVDNNIIVYDYENKKQPHTKTDQYGNIDIHNLNQNLPQEYQSSFYDIKKDLQKNYIEDMMYRHRQFYMNDESRLLFAYLTDFNILKNKRLDVDIYSKAKKYFENKNDEMGYNNFKYLFDYIIGNNSSSQKHILQETPSTQLKHLYEYDRKIYLYTVKRLYKEMIKDGTLQSNPTQLQKFILG